jgi:ABC-type phosphate transport system permease subunit
MKRAALFLFAGTLLLAGLAAPALAQCTMCKMALTNSAEGQRIAQEFNRAILLMVAAPYLVFGSIAVYLFRSRIREWLAARSSSPSPSPSLSA